MRIRASLLQCGATLAILDYVSEALMRALTHVPGQEAV